MSSLEQIMHLLLGLLSAHHNKIPRLHEANRRRVMRRHQYSAQRALRHRVGQKLATHVAAGENRL